MTQNERLDLLIGAFKSESSEYDRLKIPADVDGKRRVLRSLMNIRPPAALDEKILEIQNDYLSERIRENGIVAIHDVKTLKEMYKSAHDLAEKLSLWQGDITRIAADAIVNAANSQMLGCFVPMHTCIDNCIHTYAGVGLRAECYRRMSELRRKYGQDYEQPTAVPMITDAYNLPAKKVVHIVGPIVNGRLTERHARDLANCYTRTLDACLENRLRSVAFCCISTGVFNFPNDVAAKIAVREVSEWLRAHGEAMDRVIFCVFKDEDRKLYEKELCRTT